MSGWEQARRVPLAEPWQDFWVDVNPDLPMGVWLDFREAWKVAAALPTAESIAALIAFFPQIIVRHNIKRKDGTDLELTIRDLTPQLVMRIKTAIEVAQEGAGSAVDPFGNLEPSPGPSLLEFPSQPASPSSTRSAATPTHTSRSSRRRAG